MPARAAGELHCGHNGAAGEVDFALVGLAQDVDPCAGAVSYYAACGRAGRHYGARPALRRAGHLRHGAGGRRVRTRGGDEVARRIALHIAWSRPSPTSRSSSWAAGSARMATCSSSQCVLASRLDPLPAAGRGVRARRGRRPHRGARVRPPPRTRRRRRAAPSCTGLVGARRRLARPRSATTTSRRRRSASRRRPPAASRIALESQAT